MRKRALMTIGAALAAAGLLTGCGPTGPTTETSPPGTQEPAPEPSPGDETPSGEPRDVIDDPPAHTWEQALEAARAKFEGGITKIELDREGPSNLEYKIVLVSDTHEYSVEFDAETLEQTDEEQEALEDDAAEEQAAVFDPDDLIGLDRAVKAAREAHDGVIIEWKVEGKDDGRVKYEFDVASSETSGDVEVEIDARSGEVIEVG